MELVMSNDGTLNISKTTVEELKAFVNLVSGINATNNGANNYHTAQESVKEESENLFYNDNKRVYSDDFKKKVLKEAKNGKKPSEISEKYGIPENTVYTWVWRDKHKKKRTEKKEYSKSAIKLKSISKGYTLTEKDAEYKNKALRLLCFIAGNTDNTKNQILHDIYDDLNKNYGIVYAQLIKDIKSDFGIEDKISTFDAICMTKEDSVKKVFFDALLGMAFSVKPFCKEFNDCFGVIEDIVDILDDKSLNHASTYIKIYKIMEDLFNVNWEYHLKEYEKSHNIKLKPKKLNLVKESTSLQRNMILAVNILTYEVMK